MSDSSYPLRGNRGRVQGGSAVLEASAALWALSTFPQLHLPQVGPASSSEVHSGQHRVEETMGPVHCEFSEAAHTGGCRHCSSHRPAGTLSHPYRADPGGGGFLHGPSGWPTSSRWCHVCSEETRLWSAHNLLLLTCQRLTVLCLVSTGKGLPMSASPGL